MKNSLSIKVLLSFLISLLILPAFGARPDNRSRLYKFDQHQSRSSENDETKYVPLILELKDTEDDSVLDELEAIVFHRRGRLVLACVPEENIERLFRSEFIDNLSIARTSYRNLDVARRVAGVDVLHQGVSMPSEDGPRLLSLTGKGVLTGIVDIGFDPNHAAFKDRLIYWSIYNEEEGLKTEMDSPSAIYASGIETDCVEETHATHVGNILAGGYKGNQYYGAATESLFAVSTSSITDVGILAGIEDIISVAERENMPCVINVSCGSYLGPHDGTDLFNRYLEALEDRAIICFSSGNYGRRDLNFDVVLSEDRGCTWCDTQKWDGFKVMGSSDFWSDTSDRFEFQYTVYDCDQKRYVYKSDWFGGEGDGYVNISTDSVEVLKNLFKSGGEVAIAWGVDANNNRFNVTVDYDSETEFTQTGGPWARYFTGFRLRPVDKTVRVRAWSDGVYSYFHPNGVPGFIKPNKDNSATNFANGEAGIVVGAWNSRNRTPLICTDSLYFHDFDVDRVADWSASGETFYGRRLPDICGPGNILVSAMSSPHFNTGTHDPVAAKTDDYYWFAESGTSMSSPLVAGVLALWKEFYPALSTKEARKFLAASANSDFTDISDPRWGPGAVDAVKGLNMIAEYVGYGSVTDVVVGEEIVEYYNLQGVKLGSPEMVKDEIVIERRINLATGQSVSKKIRL